jgi:2OG-Fe(II) oxygenase superfamily
MRYATILFYLNEGMGAGETAFPRWHNADTGEQLMVKPETGKAVLFYSLLPDGNMDERSQHAAQPVTAGEKWLTNLWCKYTEYLFLYVLCSASSTCDITNQSGYCIHSLGS